MQRVYNDKSDSKLLLSLHITVPLEISDPQTNIKLRIRKHVLCFHEVIETGVEVWGTRNAVRTRAAGECFHSFFEFSQNFTMFLLRWMETVCSTFQDLQLDGSL